MRYLWFSIYCILKFLCTSAQSCIPVFRNRCLILDIDSTLYNEKDCNIETRIRNNIYRFGETLGFKDRISEIFYSKYGSSIYGMEKDEFNEQHFDLLFRDLTLVHFYNSAYRINSGLLNLVQYSSMDTETIGVTGYSRSIITDHYKAVIALQLLSAVSGLNIAVIVMSNSPRYHIKRILNRLGLQNLLVAAIISPEQCGGQSKSHVGYWHEASRTLSSHNLLATLFDDNSRNIAAARDMGIEGILVENVPEFQRSNPNSYTLSEALLIFLNILPELKVNVFSQINTSPSILKDDENGFPLNGSFVSSVSYLRAKNRVDSEAFNKEV